MPAIKPLLKPYSETIKTAARLFGISKLDAEIEMDRRLRKLKIPKIAVVVYVNWASHNALTRKEVTKATGLTEDVVIIHLQTIKRKWKHLFNFGARPKCNKGCGPLPINMNWVHDGDWPLKVQEPDRKLSE